MKATSIWPTGGTTVPLIRLNGPNAVSTEAESSRTLVWKPGVDRQGIESRTYGSRV